MSLTRRQILTSIIGSRVSTEASSKPPHEPARPMSDGDWGTLLRSGTSRYGRDREELLIRHFFRDRRDGVFVDVGCFLPEKNSATCFLERHLGWSGLAIDAQDHAAAWQRLRPRSCFVEAVLTDRADERVTFFDADGSSTLVPERLDEEPFPWERRPRIMTSETLDDVLERTGTASFDLLAININGVELRVLAGLDLRRYRPALIKIHCGRGQRRPTIEHLASMGYRLIKDYRPFDPFNRYFTTRP